MSSSISYDALSETTAHVINSSGVLLVFDYFLTLDLEVEHIWSRKFSVTSLIFYLNRYCSIIEALLNCMGGYVMVTHLGCSAEQGLFEIFHISCLVIASVFNALRVWAIWGQRWIALVVVLALGMIAPVINIYTVPGVRYAGVVNIQYPYGGCQFTSVVPSDVFATISAIARISAILCDLLVLVGTLSKTLRLKHLAKNAGVEATYSSLLVRDGSLYFAFLLAMNTTNLAIDYASKSGNPFISYLNPLTSILISRFILNLRSFDPHASDPNVPTLTNSNSQGSTIQFTSPSLIGNIGAPIDYHNPSTEDLANTLTDETQRQMVEDPLSVGLISLHEV